MSKNILFVCEYFYPNQLSSAVLPYELAQILLAEGFNVNVLTGNPTGKRKKNVDYLGKLQVTRIKYFSSNKKMLNRLRSMLSFCLAVIKNAQAFKNIDYCISYTNPPLLPPLVAFLSKKYKFKYIFEIYDLYPDTAISANILKKESIVAVLFTKLTNYALIGAYKIIVLANECKEYLLKTREMLSQENIVVIPNWYKPSYISEKTYPKKTLNIFYGGNMGIMQDMQTILETAQRLNNDARFKFVFVGQGTKRDDIASYISSNQLSNCELFDFLPKERYDELLKEADLAILSLECFGVGLGSPSKYYGYLSHGIPIIAIISGSTDIAKDICEYQNGIHIKNGDIETFVFQLNSIYENQDKLIKMGKQSLFVFNKKYTLKLASSKFLYIFK